MYVDRGQKEVSKILSDRYMQNFMQTEAMRKEAAALQAAPFEGDEALKTEILQDTDQFIQAAATAGDYENMTSDVVRAAGNYSARVQPIQQNLQKWQSYQESIDKMVEEGNLPLDNAQRLKSVSAAQYAGLQKDESGQITNMFQGIDAARDPDIMTMMDDALKGIKSSSGSTIRRYVGVDSEKGLLEVETEKGREYIDMNEVQQVIDPIFNDPNVTAFMQQSAMLNQAVKDDQVVLQEASNSMQREIQSIDNLQAQLARETDPEAKADLQNEIDNRLQIVSKTKTTIESGDVESLRRKASAEQMRTDEMRFRESMGAKYGFDKITDSYKQFHDKMKLAKEQQPPLPVAPMFTYTGEMREIPNPYGQNYEQLQTQRKSNIASAETVMQFMKDNPNLSPEARAASNAELQGYLQDIAVSNTMLMSQFEGNPPSVYKREEYERLKNAVKTAQDQVASASNNAAFMMAGSAGAGAALDLSELNKAQQNLQNFIRGTGFVVRNPTINYAPEFALNHAPGLEPDSEQNKELISKLTAYWQSGLGKTIFDPNTGTTSSIQQRKQETLGRMQDKAYVLGDGDIPPAYEVKSISIQRSAPGIGGPIIGVSVVATSGDQKGQECTFYAPGSDVNVPKFQEWANAPSTQTVGLIDKMALGTGVDNFTIPTTDADGDNWKINVSVEGGRKYAIFVDEDGKESKKHMVGSQKFMDYADKLNISYGFEATTQADVD
jgi:hypothetical protein